MLALQIFVQACALLIVPAVVRIVAAGIRQSLTEPETECVE